MKQYNDIPDSTEYGIALLKNRYQQVQQMKEKVKDPFYDPIFNVIDGLVLKAKVNHIEPKYFNEFLEFMENKHENMD